LYWAIGALVVVSSHQSSGGCVKPSELWWLGHWSSGGCVKPSELWWLCWAIGALVVVSSHQSSGGCVEPLELWWLCQAIRALVVVLSHWSSGGPSELWWLCCHPISIISSMLNTMHTLHSNHCFIPVTASSRVTSNQWRISTFKPQELAEWKHDSV
jgi:hypothetical protein